MTARPLPARAAASRAVLPVLLGALVLAGCASAEEEPTAPATAAAPAEDVRRIDVTIADGEVTPAPERIDVEQGERLRISVTSDQPDALHVHGFGDPELALEPGEPGVLEVAADETGQFEVETHDSGLLLFTLAVR